ncbi:MAG TPA: HAMP domain-containing sensor histidine kinase [Bacteroidia bacterium]|nr:HAMP domain-containing sensor histidine kinase [Bacteroidia bacterium]
MIDITRNRRFKLRNAEVDFKNLVNESVRQLSRLEGAHRLEVKTLIEGLIPFYNDPDQLQVIFNNLISNAIKFQHAHEVKPKLEIVISIDASKAIISFHDNGIGIAKDEMGKVFDMFYRAQGTKADGSGLGLYIVKELTRKLKGRIYVESLPGQGSKFVIELPNKIDPDVVRKLSKLIQNS